MYDREEASEILRSLVMTKTETEKLFDAFSRKYLKMISLGGKIDETDWIDYLDDMEGLEHVRKFGDYMDPLDYLLESINLRLGERFVLRDPCERNWFIIIEKELARKILVLGDLP